MPSLDHAPNTTRPGQPWLALAGFVVLVVGGGVAIGVLATPGGWYASLIKPSFNPPNWIFGPVWTALYVMIAVAGWRTWRRNAVGSPMMVWWVQLILNFCWSPAFFGLRQMGLALVIIVALLAVILAFIALSWRRDRIAASLFIPYAVWVAFATLLNAAIYRLN